ncbi:DUF1120 domain-containing protein [Pseudomonas reactans]|uniref:DUF1120 domain-containing protein n=1 Tax=Pseudomonas reactans TaxID=117680 RepID=UPI0015BD96D8|nr:DUF1120 domain-containing protein [Pseudomonas reactans]NWD82753.1 DUF1120 domain-containing protein [Pseudomonas reactans]
MRNTRSLLIGVLLASAGNAIAASSVDLTVKGSITPSACTPLLSSGGVADFGKISVKDLRPDKPTYLPIQPMQMTVTCEAATLIAIAAQDNREGTESDLDYYKFGIGLTNASEKLGYVTISLSAMVDEQRVRVIGSQDGGQTWRHDSSLMDDGLTSFAVFNTLTPIPVTRLEAALQTRAVIAPANNLTFNQEEPIDGSVTLTVRYL